MGFLELVGGIPPLPNGRPIPAGPFGKFRIGVVAPFLLGNVLFEEQGFPSPPGGPLPDSRCHAGNVSHAGRRDRCSFGNKPLDGVLPKWQHPGMERVHPLSAYRKEHSLTLAGLARMLDVYPSTVLRWERGRKINENDLPKVSEATGIAPADLRPDLVELLKDRG